MRTLVRVLIFFSPLVVIWIEINSLGPANNNASHCTYVEGIHYCKGPSAGAQVRVLLVSLAACIVLPAIAYKMGSGKRRD